jgi:murein DD-endopeptidase MepM/ murein hydrolase activator NlpD
VSNSNVSMCRFSSQFSGSLVASICFGFFGLSLAGCQIRRQESAELILSGSVSESSEVVELDPVFLARQRLVESRFFGFGENASEKSLPKAPSANAESEDLAESDVDLAVTSNSVAEIPGSFRGLALQWPVQGNITSPFGMRHGRLHAGIDIKGNKGDPVYSAADGQVLFSKVRKAYGKAVIVGHSHDNQTLYGHLNQFAVREGQYVKRGDLVGYVGRTGRATGFHLHFETRVNGGIPQNPMKFLPRAFSSSEFLNGANLFADVASK